MGRWSRWGLQRAFEWARQTFVLGEFRGGQLVGMDRLGNRYYEVVDEGRMLPFRNRYVEYAKGRQKDASQIPAEWHGWLHSINDDPPVRVEYAKSVADVGHEENGTGTTARYVPYNTVRAKIDAYRPERPERPKAALAERLRDFVNGNKQCGQ